MERSCSGTALCSHGWLIGWEVELAADCGAVFELVGERVLAAHDLSECLTLLLRSHVQNH
jgi:hypothetical protein